MNRFVDKAVRKINQLDIKQITRIINDLNGDAEMLADALDALPYGIIILDEHGLVRFVSANTRTLVPLFRPGSDDWEGSPLQDVIDSKELVDYVGQFLTGKSPVQNEFDYQRGAKVRTIQVDVRSLGSRTILLLSDVTERNEAEAKYHQREYLASMTTMAASVAHEIKNPLAGMKIYLDLMQRKLQKKGSVTLEESKQYLDILYEEIDRLNSIVVDYLFAVRPMHVVLRENDLEPTIDEVIAFVKPELSQSHVDIQKDFSSSVTRVAYDAKMVKNVLLNLIRNAMAAMPGGGTITLRLRLDGNNVALDVSDTGVGIPAENLSKIFEPYFTTKGEKGTGLGLTIVYKIMREHHGDVTVSSQVGVGTTFTLLFPVPASSRLGLTEGDGQIDGKSEEVKE